MERWERKEQLGTGSFGIVYRGIRKEDGLEVAIKKIKFSNSKDGVSFAAIREIKFMREIDHPHILKMLDVYQHKGSMHLVLEYMQTDLEEQIRNKELVFSEGKSGP